jgi:hypothetical protein
MQIVNVLDLTHGPGNSYRCFRPSSQGVGGKSVWKQSFQEQEITNGRISAIKEDIMSDKYTPQSSLVRKICMFSPFCPIPVDSMVIQLRCY